MEKKTINFKETSFTQAINISAKWCKELEEDLLSEEVFADRISELIKTKNGARGFFAYTLSDTKCTLLDKLPSSLIFILRERGEHIVEITIKNLFMSSAQIFNHQKDKNFEYAQKSNDISNRCINLLKVLDTNLVTEKINKMLSEIDKMGNSFDNKVKFSEKQKEFIRYKVNEIAN